MTDDGARTPGDPMADAPQPAPDRSATPPTPATPAPGLPPAPAWPPTDLRRGPAPDVPPAGADAPMPAAADDAPGADLPPQLAYLPASAALEPLPDVDDAAADADLPPYMAALHPGHAVAPAAASSVAPTPAAPAAPAPSAASAPASTPASPAAPASPAVPAPAAAPAAATGPASSGTLAWAPAMMSGPAPAAAAAAAAAATAAETAATSREAAAGTGEGGRVRRLSRAWGATVIGVLLAVIVVLAMVRSGFVDDFSNTLQVMGFDPDRAILLVSLLLGCIGAALVAIVGGRFPVAVITGAVTVLFAFAEVFRQETHAALSSKGSDGTFDPVGWALTAVTLFVSAVIAGWGAAVLGRDVHGRLVAVGGSVRTLGSRSAGRGRRARSLAHVAVAIGVVALLAVSFPIFGDMMNFEPDAHMRQGGPAGVSLFGGNADAGGAGTGTTADGNPAASATTGGAAQPSEGVQTEPLVIPAGLVAGPVAGSFVTSGALGTARPWAAKPPDGGGRTLSVNMPAPWTGGIRDYATIDIYLPPGYDANPTMRYPVIYEPHQPLWAWEQGMHVVSLLDSLIRSGTMPPEIVVFVGQYGGPYADSECADSWDGKEWFDTYLGQDVPQYMDANFRTIATPAARSLLGFSSGGYCAAAALAHHPDTFSTAMIFSGYFQAGVQTSTTPVAGRPFNNDPALEAKVSPINVVPKLTDAQRAQIFYTFSASPENRFYGDQITAFADVLNKAGVAMAILPTPLGHSWTAVRDQLPTVLAMLAARQVKLGVFK